MNPGKSVALHPFRLTLNFSALQRDVIRMAAFMAMVGTTSPLPSCWRYPY